MMKNKTTIHILLAGATIFLGSLRCYAFGNPIYGGYGAISDSWWQEQIVSCLISGIVGACLGVFFSDRLRRLRRILALIVLAVIMLLSLALPVIGQAVSFIVGFCTAMFLLSDKQKQALYEKLAGRFKRIRQTVFGSAQWADMEHIKDAGLGQSEGFFIGAFRHRLPDGSVQTLPLHYNGDRHLLSFAPTRIGKGTSAIAPNLLTYEGSAFVIDPKGENAKITAARRGMGDAAHNIPGMGQEVMILDPWGIVGGKEKVACFNPLDWLDPEDEDINENAMILWDSIVMQRPNASEPFWDDEARSLGVGLTLHVATAESEKENRTLGRVRDIIVMSRSDFDLVLHDMLASENPVVRSTATRTACKEEKLLSNVLAALQSHTHFLDSPRMRKSLSRSDFRFEDLKTKKMTVYLVLPVDRLKTFGRWLRLLVQQAITVNARNIEHRPDKPILFLLDEMAALGRLSMVEQAYGLMAGYGMQLWGIVQDVSQLERDYGPGWETFIANSGALQYFGSRDNKSAEYFSKLAGMSTVEKFSWSQGISRAIGLSRSSGTSKSKTSTWSANSGDSSTTGSSETETTSVTDSDSDTQTQDIAQRPLIMPSELMVMRRDEGLLLVENYNPIKCFRIKWFQHEPFRSLGVNLRVKQGQEAEKQGAAV